MFTAENSAVIFLAGEIFPALSIDTNLRQAKYAIIYKKGVSLHHDRIS